MLAGQTNLKVDGSTGDIAVGTSSTPARLINLAGTDKIGIYIDLTRQRTSLAPAGFGVSDELDGSFAFGFPSALLSVT